MASLAVHIANLRAFKSVFGEALERDDESVKQGSLEHFFADEFKRESGGTFYQHLEEIAALLPDQEELKRETESRMAEQRDLMPQLREIKGKHDRAKQDGFSPEQMIGLLIKLANES